MESQEILTPKTDCEICRKIVSLYEEPDSTTTTTPLTVELGSLRDVLATGCKRHLELMDLEAHQEPTESSEGLGVLSTEDHERFSEVEALLYDNRLHIQKCYRRDDAGSRWSYTLRGLLVRLRDETTGEGHGLMLNKSWIQEGLLSKWIRSCNSHHGSSCQAPWLRFQRPGHRPRLLVDVRNNCLVDFDGQTYCALSYVWGDKISLLTTCQTIAQLKKPGELAKSQNWFSIAKTIRNAIELTRSFEWPFLWVDALCIIQDDQKMRQNEVDKMGYIFANAHVTIIAATGSHADYGLHGLHGIDEPRTLPVRPIYSLADNYKFVEPLFHWFNHVSKAGMTYSSRAWTFQEHILSQRAIIFEDQKVRWECGKADWYEDMDHEIEGDRADEGRTEVSSFRAILRGLEPDNWTLSTFVSEFNRRNLTYSQDALAACAGFLSILSSTGLVFISGMPTKTFDVAMLWQPAACIDRRVVTMDRPSSTDLESTPCLPSWSWAGWQCALDPSCWQISYEEAQEISLGYGAGHSKIRLLPTVTWQCAHDLTSERFQMLDHNLSMDVTSINQHRFRYIFCRTRRCVQALVIGARMHNFMDYRSTIYRRHPFHYEILHPTQGRVGAITVSPPTGLGEYTDYVADTVELEPDLNGTPLELVEISATHLNTTAQPGHCSSEGTFPESLQMLKDIGSTGGSQKIINVLWISWTTGDYKYAERRALGWVDSRAWSTLEFEEIDLALG